ncbi:MAG: hypothetical protein JWQ35_2685 [Bacteriovoracaceae bacterium]|nr:hypothetical protein [Bacteriovoracaceae bacterium]
MYEWLPQVCKEIRMEMIQMYWILIIPLVILCTIFIVVNAGEESGAGAKLLKRVMLSIVLLLTFDSCMNLIAQVADGIADKINGLAQLKAVLDQTGKVIQSQKTSWLEYRQCVIFFINFFSYCIAYLGFFLAEAITHFVWAILYISSPLMILMFVYEKTAFVTMNLYKGLINVATWKILWSILAVLLLKLMTTPQVGGVDSFFTSAIVNLCVGISMLFVPFATKSLIGDGMAGVANMAAGFSAGLIAKLTYGKVVEMSKKAIKAPFSVAAGKFGGRARSGQSRQTSEKP